MEKERLMAEKAEKEAAATEEKAPEATESIDTPTESFASQANDDFIPIEDLPSEKMELPSELLGKFGSMKIENQPAQQANAQTQQMQQPMQPNKNNNRQNNRQNNNYNNRQQRYGNNNNNRQQQNGRPQIPSPPNIFDSSRTPICLSSIRVRKIPARSLTSSRKSIRPSAVK